MNIEWKSSDHTSALVVCDSVKVFQKELRNHSSNLPLVRFLWWQKLSLSPEEVCAYLKEQIPFISEGILERIMEHKIDGEVFLQLNDEYLREMAPLLGDRLKLKKIINKALTESLVSHFLYYSRVISILVHITCSLEPLIAIQPRCNLLPYTLFCLSHSMYFAT